MATYGKLLSTIWSDPDFTALNSAEQQLYMLLLSHPTRNHAGVLPLTLRRWASVTAEAAEKSVKAALMRLAQTRFAVLDWDTEEVLIRTYIRNDGVYRQPNLMKSALKQAEETASPMLCKVLANEIERLENYAINPKWSTTVVVLRRRASSQRERHSDGFREPIDDDMPLAYGVGGYLSPEEVAPSPTPAPTPTHAAQREDIAAHDEVFDLATRERGMSAPVNIGASKLVDKVLPKNSVPNAHKTILRIKASELISNGETEDDISECLRIWLTKTELGPHALGSCMSEVYKKRNNGSQMSTRDRQFMATQALKANSADVKTPRQLSDELFGRARELPGGSR